MIKELTHILADMDQLTLGSILISSFVAGQPLVGQRARRRPAPVQAVRHQRATWAQEPVTQPIPLPITHQMPILSPWGES